MKIYQVSHRLDDSEHRGYDYTASKREAKELKTTSERNGQEAVINAYDFPVTRAGMLAALNQLATHPDNG